MSCIYQGCLVQSFEGELCFQVLIHFCQWRLQHSSYIVLNDSDVIGMPHWITHKQIKKQFRYPLYIRGICHTYTAAVHWYTWNIHRVIWNPTHLDRIWQNGTYVSEPCTYMSVHVHTSSWIHEHVCTWYIHVHVPTHLYVHSTYTCMKLYIGTYMVYTCLWM